MDVVTSAWTWLINKAAKKEEDFKFISKVVYTENIRGKEFCFSKCNGKSYLEETEISIKDLLNIPQEIISSCGANRLGLCEVKLNIANGAIPVVSLVYEMLPREGT